MSNYCPICCSMLIESKDLDPPMDGYRACVSCQTGWTFHGFDLAPNGSRITSVRASDDTN